MNYYNEIKNKLINNEINKRVKDYSKNKYELERYYKVGKLLVEAGKHYGEGIIKEYSKKLTSELGRGFSETRLKYIRRFYEISVKSPSLTDVLTYTHYCEVIWFDDIDKINYYIKIAKEQNLSVRKLREKIKSREYERLSDDAKVKLKNNSNIEMGELVPDPILIKSNGINKDKIKEKILKQLIMENIDDFLK